MAALISTQSNISVALEQMAREIRTGYLFCATPGNGGLPNICDQGKLGPETGCTSNGYVWTCNDILNFYNADGNNIDYELAGRALTRSQNGPNGSFTPITGSNVNVSGLTFTIFGNTEGDNWPPRITISMSVAPSSSDPALAGDVLNLQTTVSAREIDCTPGSSPQC